MLVRRRKRDGFTLIELLVVIAIIAILAAILFPVFATAKSKAKTSQCQSNLKQIMLAWNQYVEDYDGRTAPLASGYVPYPPWAKGLVPYNGTEQENDVTLTPYLRSRHVTDCPEHQPNRYGGVPYVAGKGQYGYNIVYMNYGGDVTAARNFNGLDSRPSKTTMSMVGSPARTICFIDSLDTVAIAPTCSWMGNPYYLAVYMAASHNGGWNVAFVDGHVGHYKKAIRYGDEISWDDRLWALNKGTYRKRR
jgi:prepilin-type N-terminal cleavage/methylation domain-containing protein/prepilin-type processing-associated H-X9-DG protein